jgi:hypothetical protein
MTREASTIKMNGSSLEAGGDDAVAYGFITVTVKGRPSVGPDRRAAKYAYLFDVAKNGSPHLV